MAGFVNAKRTLHFLLLGGLLILSAARAGEDDAELWRPQFHFTTSRHWMNDPNGLVYLHGTYHLFYQYNPGASVWGPMHWGHASSTDLLHWRQQPIALKPDALGMIFSGSVVVDQENSSGLGKAGRPPLVALFTYHDNRRKAAGRDDFESQGLAYSLDEGRHWLKYARNPVLQNPGARDFRDPKVSWFQARQIWIMTLAVGDHVSFYSSKDLKEWQHESDFRSDESGFPGVWECPDLIEMKSVGTEPARFVLLVSVNPGGPNGGSGTRYFVGQFDGHAFTAENSTPQWLDFGTDDYAGVTWSGIPSRDGRRLFIGWMNNWIYGEKVPTGTWRGAMTFPRELQLVKTDLGYRVHAAPVRELERLFRSTYHLPSGPSRMVQLPEAATRGGVGELKVRLVIHDQSALKIRFSNTLGERTIFTIDRRLGRYTLDRSASGDVGFDPTFSTLQTAPIVTTRETITLIFLLDRASLEVFANGGETVLTTVHFPHAPLDRIEFEADKPFVIDEGVFHRLRATHMSRTRADAPTALNE